MFATVCPSSQIDPARIDWFSFLVTDRLAFLNFVHGSLASSLAVRLDSARTPLKTFRDAETALTPRRNIRAGIQLQINRLEHDNQKGLETKLKELKEQLRRAELEDENQEKELALLKRKVIKESEQLKWDAMREVRNCVQFDCALNMTFVAVR